MNKKTSIIIAIMMLISISLAVAPTVNADDPPGNPHAVRGHVSVSYTHLTLPTN